MRAAWTRPAYDDPARAPEGPEHPPSQDCESCVMWQGTPSTAPWGHCPRVDGITYQWHGCARHISRDEHGGEVTQ